MDSLILYTPAGPDVEEEETIVSGPLSVEQELERFRALWREELQEHKSAALGNTREESEQRSPRQEVEEPSTEEQAKFLFMQGVNAEELGKYYEAIQFYRRAVQLVPDIEFRVADYKDRLSRVKKKERTISECSSDSTCLGDHEDPDDLSQLLTYFQKLKVSENGFCEENISSMGAHMSVLPVEVLQYIFKWVVTSDLDVVSLEYLSLVCRGFYICARDEELWRLICQKVWGPNCGDCANYGSFRDMYYQRPHLRFTGCYISRTSYYRQGEETLSEFYKPFHRVEYYRYARFFPEGHMLLWTSVGDPLQSLQKLKTKYSREQGVMYGYYRLAGNQLSAVLKRRKFEKKADRFRNRNRNNENNSQDLSFHVEMELCSSGKRPNSMLEWKSYSVISVNRSTGEKTSSTFELQNQTYPPLIFSRVKSYTHTCDSMLA